MDYLWQKQDCVICGPQARTFVGYRGGRYHRAGLGVETAIHRCNGCDLIFPDPVPVPVGGVEQHYSMAPDEYFALHDFDTKLGNADKLLREAEGLMPVGSLLDVGAGLGNVSIRAKERGWTVTCIEPSSSFAAGLRSKGLEVHETTLEKSPLTENSFDAVILSAVFEHLYNPAEILSATRRVLRPGGIVFLDVPNERGLYFKVGNLRERLRGSQATLNLSPTFPPFHIFGYSPKSLSSFLAKNGLDPVILRLYSGHSSVPGKGMRGRILNLATEAVLQLGRLPGQGAFIECWARKN